MHAPPTPSSCPAPPGSFFFLLDEMITKLKAQLRQRATILQLQIFFLLHLKFLGMYKIYIIFYNWSALALMVDKTKWYAATAESLGPLTKIGQQK